MGDEEQKKGKNFQVSPFDDLSDQKAKPKDEATQSKETKTDASVLETDEKRSSISRYMVEAGNAVLYELNGKIITKAVLRNLSPGGAGIETPAANLTQGSTVVIEFGGKGIKLGGIKCSIQWIAPAKMGPPGTQTVGIQFVNLTPQMKKTLEAYFSEIKGLAGRWS